MNHFITLFVLITLALSQDNTGTVITKADCTKEGACPADTVFIQVMCTDPTTQKEYPLQWNCVNSPKDPSICVWDTPGCPVAVCSCPKETMPAGTNYLCADGYSWGGPTCTPECVWTEVKCEPYVEKTGYCPIPTVKSDNILCASAVGTCVTDSDCEGTAMCCKNECNCLSCQQPTEILVRPGVCPAVKEGDVGICGIACANDGECAENQKCCPNGCNTMGGSTCVNVFDPTTTDKCEYTQCDPNTKPQTFASTICPDGVNIQGPFCEPCYKESDPSTGTTDVVKVCDWTFHPCPIAPPPVHKGSCPIFNTLVACDATTKPEDECESDANCDLSLKCCHNGCSRVCCNAIAEETCTVVGYKDYYCMDYATAEATASTTNTATETSILPGDDCWYRCKQNSLCSYDLNTSTCDRDEEYYKCIANCENPDPTPVDPICAYKTSCGCLADTTNECGWCQVKAYTTSADGTTTTPYSWGYCAPPSGTNVCSASFSSGGKEGSFCTVAPTECIDDYSVDPAIKDTSSYFPDKYEQYKTYFNDINTGKLTESAVQKVVDTCKGECDITIDKMLSAVVDTDGTKGSVSCIIQIHNCDKTLEDIGKCILKAYSTTSGIPESSFKDNTFKPYSETVTTVKRATGTGSYLQSATVDPSTSDVNNSQNSAARTLAPMWMMLCAIFLFFRM